MEETKKEYKKILEKIKRIESFEKRMSRIEGEVGIREEFGIGALFSSLIRTRPSIKERLKEVEEKLKNNKNL